MCILSDESDHRNDNAEDHNPHRRSGCNLDMLRVRYTEHRLDHDILPGERGLQIPRRRRPGNNAVRALKCLRNNDRKIHFHRVQHGLHHAARELVRLLIHGVALRITGKEKIEIVRIIEEPCAMPYAMMPLRRLPRLGSTADELLHVLIRLRRDEAVAAILNLRALLLRLGALLVDLIHGDLVRRRPLLRDCNRPIRAELCPHLHLEAPAKQTHEDNAQKRQCSPA